MRQSTLHRETRIRLGVLALVAAIAGMLLTAGGAFGGGRGAPVSTVQVNATPVTRGLPADFVGVALEESTIPGWIDDPRSPTPVDPILANLIRTLAPTGRPVIRIGGISTDHTWWPIPNMATPLGTTYTLTPTWAADLRQLTQTLDARLILSINLEDNSLAVSRQEASQLYTRIGSRYIDAMEIGNEPSRYALAPLYRVLDGRDIPWYEANRGRPVYGRRFGYDVQDFINDFLRTLKVLPASVGVTGPDAVSFSWLKPFEARVTPTHRLRILDIHDYPLSNCQVHRSAANYPSIPHMLARSAWSGLLTGGAVPAMQMAHRAGQQFRIDEMGSVTCGGHAGVSNTMASALWITNALMFVAQEGVDGVNLHTYPNVPNRLLDLTDTPHGWRGVLHPFFDGAAMFTRADPAGARQLSVTQTGPATLQTWATRAPDGVLRVLVVNSGTARRVQLTLPSPWLGRSAAVQRLLAPHVTSTSGLTLGGRQVDTTTTGVLPAPRPQTLAPSHSGGLTVAAPAYSETLLTITPR